jgi:dUTP pyrophosphatase
MIINRSNNPNPEYKTKESAGFDIAVNLTSLEQIRDLNKGLDIQTLIDEKDLSKGFKINIRPFQQLILPTGLYLDNMKLQMLGNSYFNENIQETLNRTPVLKIYIKSSIGIKGLILSNNVGVIDIDYPNEIMLMIRNLSSDDITIKHGDRLAQGLIEYIIRPESMIKDEVRVGGFGSTGQ